MTPDGWCTVFSAGLDSMGGQECTPFSPEIPHSGQNGPKSPQKGRGYPPFCTFLSCTSIIFFLEPAGRGGNKGGQAARQGAFFSPPPGGGGGFLATLPGQTGAPKGRPVPQNPGRQRGIFF